VRDLIIALREVPGLTAAVTALESSAAGVSAAASPSPPAPLGALLLFIGALASTVMGITTAFAFAVRGGFPLAALQAVLPGLVG